MHSIECRLIKNGPDRPTVTPLVVTWRIVVVVAMAALRSRCGHIFAR